MLRVELESGETEILVTSLTDMKTFSYYHFSELYHLRRPIEEDYKTIKYRFEVENFSGKSVLPVYQDFHAKLFSKNLAAAVASTTKKQILKKSENFKYAHQINFAQALSKMQNTIVLLFNQPLEQIGILDEKLRAIFIQTTEAIRPNRKYPRHHRVKQARFFYEHKTTC